MTSCIWMSDNCHSVQRQRVNSSDHAIPSRRYNVEAQKLPGGRAISPASNLWNPPPLNVGFFGAGQQGRAAAGVWLATTCNRAITVTACVTLKGLVTNEWTRVD